MSARLVFSFGLLIAIVVCLGLLGLRHLRADAELEAIVDARQYKEHLSRNALDTSNLNNRITMQVFLIKDENEINLLLKQRAKNTEKISALIETLRTRIESSQEAGLLDAIDKNRIPYVESYRQALHLLVDEKKPVEGRAVMVQEALPKLLRYHAAWNAYVLYQGDQLNQAQSANSSNYLQMRIEAFSLISLAIALAVAIAFFVTRNLTRHMARRKLAEEGLRQAHDQLERRVKERTAQLAAANDDLQTQMAARGLIESELRNSEERYRKMVEGAKDMIYRLSPTGHFTFVNPAAAAAMKMSVAECVGLHFLSLVRDDFKKATLKFYAQQLRDNVPVTYFELPTLAKDGSEIWVGQNVQLRTENGEVVGLQAVGRDITSRKEIEGRLLESESRYRQLFQSNPQPMWVFDSETLGFLAVNDAAVLRYGYSREEFLGMTIKDIRPEEDIPQLFSNKATLADGFARYDPSCDWRHRKKDGSLIDVEITWHELGFAGRPAKLVLAQDITERKRAQEKIGQLAQIVESSHDAIIATDLHGNIVSWNPGAERIYGYRADEVLGKHISLLVPADRQEEIREKKRRLESASGDRIAPYEAERLRKDGQRIQVSVSLSRWKDAGGRVVGSSIIARDITGRKRMEEERQAIFDIIQGVNTTHNLDELLGLIHKSIGQLLYAENCFVALHDPETNFIHFEFWVDKIDPCPSPRPVGIGFSSYVLRTGKALLLDRELTERMYQSGEVEKSGTPSASWLGVPLQTKSRSIGVLVVQHYEDENAYDERDLEFLASVGNQIALAIERRRAERNLRETEDQLRQAQKMESIGTLAGGIAHDFNNLMTAVTGYSELALRNLKAEDSLRPKIEEIKKAGERAAALTGQLLAFSRKQMLQPKVFDLNAVITGMGKMLTRVIGEDLDLSIELKTSLGQVKADPGQIEQVVLNLAVNARDAMPGGGHLTIKTENVHFDRQFAGRRTVVQPGHYVMLSVSDDGCGMDAETQSHIFDPFFTTKEVGKGTGLGLSTVYGIVKQSGGSIWVYSEVDRGTTFKIYLPRVDDVDESEVAANELSLAQRGSETILLVEDEDMVRELSKEILQEYGYAVITAQNGHEGLRICQEFEGNIDLMITDVVMPKMSGRQLAESIGTARPDTRVLYMSGFTDDAVVRHGVLDDGVCFIQKPFSPDALAAKAREVLDRRA